MGRSHRRAAKAEELPGVDAWEAGSETPRREANRACKSEDWASGGAGGGKRSCEVNGPQTDGERFVKRLLQRYADGLRRGGTCRLAAADEQLMRKVLAGHPERSRLAASGVVSIRAKLTEHSSCFTLFRGDGTCKDIAWKTCCRGLQEDIAAWRREWKRDQLWGGAGGREYWSSSETHARPGPPRRSQQKAGSEIMGMLRAYEHGERVSRRAGRPLPLSTDEFLLAAVEAREDAERGADRHNLDTFGEDAAPGGGAWDYEAMLEANRSLWESSVARAAAAWGEEDEDDEGDGSLGTGSEEDGPSEELEVAGPPPCIVFQ